MLWHAMYSHQRSLMPSNDIATCVDAADGSYHAVASLNEWN